MSDNYFLRKVYDWGVGEKERGGRSDLAGAARYYAAVIVGSPDAASGIQDVFERVYDQGKRGEPFLPIKGDDT